MSQSPMQLQLRTSSQQLLQIIREPTLLKSRRLLQRSIRLHHTLIYRPSFLISLSDVEHSLMLLGEFLRPPEESGVEAPATEPLFNRGAPKDLSSRTELSRGGMKKSLPSVAGRLQALLQLRVRLLGVGARNWKDATLNGRDLQTATSRSCPCFFRSQFRHAIS